MDCSNYDIPTEHVSLNLPPVDLYCPVVSYKCINESILDGFQMEKINPSGYYYLRNVTIVGTRHSYSFDVDNIDCKTQVVDVETQFRMGVRAFHVRIGRRVNKVYPVVTACGSTYVLLDTFVHILDRLLRTNNNTFVVLFIDYTYHCNSEVQYNELLRYVASVSSRVSTTWSLDDSVVSVLNKILVHVLGNDRGPLGADCQLVDPIFNSNIVMRWNALRNHVSTLNNYKCMIIFLGHDAPARPMVSPPVYMATSMLPPYTDRRKLALVDNSYSYRIINKQDFYQSRDGNLTFLSGINALFIRNYRYSDTQLAIYMVDFPSKSFVDIIRYNANLAQN